MIKASAGPLAASASNAAPPTNSLRGAQKADARAAAPDNPVLDINLTAPSRVSRHRDPLIARPRRENVSKNQARFLLSVF